jgi:hypothetical protein
MSTNENNLICLNAYMLWIGANCYAIKPSEAFKKYPENLWSIETIVWVRTMILSQDTEGLSAMRSEYSTKTGKDWKIASLSDVYKTLGNCSELWKKGKVLIGSMPNVKAIFEQGGINDPKLTMLTTKYLKTI